MSEIKLGKYEHSKSGRKYEVIGIARHSETLEKLVVYKALYKSEEFSEGALWVRPKDMFFDKVNINNQGIPRFKYLG